MLSLRSQNGNKILLAPMWDITANGGSTALEILNNTIRFSRKLTKDRCWILFNKFLQQRHLIFGGQRLQMGRPVTTSVRNRLQISNSTSLVATMVRHMEGKAMQIHNLYIVVIKGTLILLHSLCSCHSPQRHWSAPCVKSGESPQSVHISVPRIYF
jgi:hypothetical protein